MAENYKHLLSDSFWRSRIWKEFSWVVLAEGLLWSCDQVCQPGCGLIWRLGWGEIHFQAHSCGCLRETLAPCHVGDVGLLPKWLVPEQVMRKEKETERERVRERLQSLLSPNLRSDAPSLLLYAIGHADQPWYNVGGDCSRARPWGDILEAGCHIRMHLLARKSLRSSCNTTLRAQYPLFLFPLHPPLRPNSDMWGGQS